MLNTTGKIYNLSGIWSVSTGDGKAYDMKIPGTLDESNIGHRDMLKPKQEKTVVDDFDQNPLDHYFDDEGFLLRDSRTEELLSDENPILTRYTRKYTYEGPVRIYRMMHFKERAGKRYFFEVERGRELSLSIDGVPVPPFSAPSLTAPIIFEVTGRISGNHMVSFESDNSYPVYPREEILESNMASDETQTNWNGLLGRVILREESQAFIEKMLVRTEGKQCSVYLEIATSVPCEGTIYITSDAFEEDCMRHVALKKERNALLISGLKLRSSAAQWGFSEGNLHEIHVTAAGQTVSTTFGIRTLSGNANGRILLNDHVLFLRGETNEAVHPETSYPPFDISAWEKILKQYMLYGVNLLRFKSSCPPEAAFIAADRLGMLLMPELPVAALSTDLIPEEVKLFFKKELLQMLKYFGNHPSFAILSLAVSEDVYSANADYLKELVSLVRKYCPGILLTLGVNTPSSYTDVYLSDGTEEIENTCGLPMIYMNPLRGEMLPDLREADIFSGYLTPNNLIHLREEVEAVGMYPIWSHYVEAGGKHCYEQYKDTIEKAMLSDRYAGIVLTSLQDYPGKNRMPCGMLNSHMQKKPFLFADPKRFTTFFSDIIPMVSLKKRNFRYGETLEAVLFVSNFTGEDLEGAGSLTISDEDCIYRVEIPETLISADSLSLVRGISIQLNHEVLSLENEDIEKPRIMKMKFHFSKYVNEYTFFLYPSETAERPEDILLTDSLSYNAETHLKAGGTVVVSLRNKKNESTHPSVYVDKTHPFFRYFPSDDFEDAQWAPLISGRGVRVPGRLKPILTTLETDMPGNLRSMFFECRTSGGNLLVTSLDLTDRKSNEVKLFVSSLYRYLASYDFSPAREVRIEELRDAMNEWKDQ